MSFPPLILSDLTGHFVAGELRQSKVEQYYVGLKPFRTYDGGPGNSQAMESSCVRVSNIPP